MTYAEVREVIARRTDLERLRIAREVARSRWQVARGREVEGARAGFWRADDAFREACRASEAAVAHYREVTT